jgi:hypothetical protein
MEEFMFFIRKNAVKEDFFSNERYAAFLQGCENYIESLKNEDKSISESAIIFTKNGDKLIETDLQTADKTGILIDYHHILTENLETALDSIRRIVMNTQKEDARIEVHRIKTKESSLNYLFQSMA